MESNTRPGSPADDPTDAPADPAADTGAGSDRPGQVVQPHGGALYAGGVPGNRSKLGRTSIVRCLALDGLVTATPAIARMANGGENVAHSDQVAAFNALGKVSLGQTVSLQEVKERQTAQHHTIQEWGHEFGLSESAIAALVDRMSAAWGA